MRKIFCFGNEDFKGDEVAKELAKQIDNPNFEFIFAESPNEILNANEELIILDVAKGIKEVQLLTNTDNLKLSLSVTSHDLDLAFYLKLMKETGKIKNIKIIALPWGNNNYNYLKKEVEKILNKI